ncbi:hypothetical protein [Duganella sp. P38]|uniref:hypothetical protein n=1 Tax=Duganella sp. P38 TaxID=3423949 RepID=UPI003D7A1A6D
MDDHLNNLYQTDALIWTDTQIALLRAGKYDQLVTCSNTNISRNGSAGAGRIPFTTTRLPPSIFPRKCAFTKRQILDEDFFPGENEKAADP